MYLVAIAWLYVVVMMSAAEATSPRGSVLGAVFTFLLYGALPLGIVLYVLGAPARRGRRRREAATADADVAVPPDGASADDPDRRGHAAGDAVAPERKEP